uniref:Uncharacterized protein n=1 Tax=viral metagenome TaxID=1070528 RepID=A0A6M3Y091_9ZZZZ
MKFNPEKHYLGSLCHKNHNYKDTGKTVRYNSGECFLCHKRLRDKHRGKDENSTYGLWKNDPSFIFQQREIALRAAQKAFPRAFR